MSTTTTKVNECFIFRFFSFMHSRAFNFNGFIAFRTMPSKVKFRNSPSPQSNNDGPPPFFHLRTNNKTTNGRRLSLLTFHFQLISVPFKRAVIICPLLNTPKMQSTKLQYYKSEYLWQRIFFCYNFVSKNSTRQDGRLVAVKEMPPQIRIYYKFGVGGDKCQPWA